MDALQEFKNIPSVKEGGPKSSELLRVPPKDAAMRQVIGEVSGVISRQTGIDIIGEMNQRLEDAKRFRGDKIGNPEQIQGYRDQVIAQYDGDGTDTKWDIKYGLVFTGDHPDLQGVFGATVVQELTITERWGDQGAASTPKSEVTVYLDAAFDPNERTRGLISGEINTDNAAKFDPKNSHPRKVRMYRAHAWDEPESGTVVTEALDEQKRPVKLEGGNFFSKARPNYVQETIGALVDRMPEKGKWRTPDPQEYTPAPYTQER